MPFFKEMSETPMCVANMVHALVSFIAQMWTREKLRNRLADNVTGERPLAEVDWFDFLGGTQAWPSSSSLELIKHDMRAAGCCSLLYPRHSGQ